MLDVTTEGLFETVKQTDLWRLLESDSKDIEDYRHILGSLYLGQQFLETWLDCEEYWQELGLENISRLPLLETDMHRMFCKPKGPQFSQRVKVDRNRFVAALYINELLRTYAESICWQIPPHWPKSYFDHATISYRWPEVRFKLKNYSGHRRDFLEISWLAQEFLNELIEDFGNRAGLSKRLFDSYGPMETLHSA